MVSLGGPLTWVGFFILLLSGLWKFLKWHSSWIQNAESIEERRSHLREELVGKRFSEEGDAYMVEQLDYVEEKESVVYRIKKQVPYIRQLHGWTSLTIVSEGAPSRPYVWSEDDEGEAFSAYLQEVRPEDYPEVEVLSPEMDSESFTDVPIVRLRIHSLDPTVLSKTFEKIPTFHRYYFDNYPGDIRFHTKRGT